MMSEKKFNVGDRVRFIGDYTHYAEEALKNGQVYIVSNIDDWGVELSVPIESHVETEYIELVESTDPRTAFLQELKELLTKYNAEIQADKGCFDVSIDGKYALTIEGNDDYSITANNIKDYQL